MKEQMTPRERILSAIDHKPVDRIPTDYWATEEATDKLMKHTGAKDFLELYKILGIDGIMGVGPEYKGPDLKAEGSIITDYWGVKYKPVIYGENKGTYMEMCFHPLEKFETIDEIEANYTWPDANWFDFSTIAQQCSRFDNHAISGGYAAPFYMYTSIRGLEQTLVDLASDEKISVYIISKICSFLNDYHKKLFEAAHGRIDISQLTDDFGTQTGLMISIEMFNRYFGSHYRNFVKLYKDYGIRVFHHDDGAIMPLIPSLINIGIGVLNPIQWHLPGMDLHELKTRFGKSMCFHGGIDNQYVLPFGTVEEVKKEVETCMEILASDGTGFILAPCHNIQVVSPVENILTMYKSARELG